jgi:hypothetical protein
LELDGATPLQAFRIRNAIVRIDEASGPLAGQIIDLRAMTGKVEKLEKARREWLTSLESVAKTLTILSNLHKEAIAVWDQLAKEEDKRYQDALAEERKAAAEAERLRKEEEERQKKKSEPERPKSDPQNSQHAAANPKPESAGPPTASPGTGSKGESPVVAASPNSCNFLPKWQATLEGLNNTQTVWTLEFVGSSSNWSGGILSRADSANGAHYAVDVALPFKVKCKQGAMELDFASESASLTLKTGSNVLHVNKVRNGKWRSPPPEGLSFSPLW